MYSLIMLTAMASGADPTPVAQPALVVRSYGCIGSCYGSCSGCYGSCSGCSGCYGSCHGAHQGHGLFGHHRASCHGCTGYSCSGSSCFGSCHGGCCGGSCSGMPHGSSCHGCFGGCWGPSAPAIPYSAVGGAWNYGPSNIYADPHAVYGVVNYPPIVVIPAEARTTEPKPMETPIAPKPKEGMGANLKFTVPADAKLYVDGRLTMIGGTERTFTTPPLAEGQKFYYDVKAEIVVKGKVVVEEKRIIVEAGGKVTESFPVLVAAIAGKTVPVAGN